MSWLQYLYYVFAFLYVIVAPSYVLGRLLYPRERLAVRMGIGMVITVTVVPLATFGLAMLLSTVMNEALLFSVASAVLVSTLALQTLRTRRRTSRIED